MLKIKSKYDRLLKDADVSRLLRNLARCSPITAEVDKIRRMRGLTIINN